MSSRFYTQDETCFILRIGRTTLHRHRKAGTVPSEKVGSRVLIPGAYFIAKGIDPEKALEKYRREKECRE